MQTSVSAKKVAAITPSDATVVDFAAIYVGGAGNVTVRCIDGNVVTFTAPPVGFIIPVACDRVMAATTATLLIGLNW